MPSTSGISLIWKLILQIQKLNKLLEDENLQLSKSDAPEAPVSPALEIKVEKRCLAAIMLCMQMLTYGGPALEDLLRTLPGNGWA